MAAGTGKQKKKEDYLTFKELDNPQDTLNFLKERIPSPVGHPYYTPMDYRWDSMPLVVRLRETHKQTQQRLLAIIIGLAVIAAVAAFYLLVGRFDRESFVLIGRGNVIENFSMGAAVFILFPPIFISLLARKRREADARFKESEMLAFRTYLAESNPLVAWLMSRYAALDEGSCVPPEEYSYSETERTGEVKPRTGERDGVPYCWKRVEPVQESNDDKRIHCILIDKETGEEAPLLPGIQPYRAG